MKFVLVRHAEAVVLGEAGTITDFDRMLTEHGHRQAAALALALQRIGCVPDAILTSPLVRARQTAASLAQTIIPGQEPTQFERLAIGESNYRKMTREVADLGHKLVVLVGHMPQLSDYASWLLGAEAGAIDFDKAAAALVKFSGDPDQAGGELKWLVSPRWFMV